MIGGRIRGGEMRVGMCLGGCKVRRVEKYIPRVLDLVVV